MGVLEGKVAIITGGARGQGEAEARLFHAEGAAVVVTDLNEAGQALADELGERAAFIRHNVANAEEWRAVIALAKQRFNKVDILVNNAGITGYEAVDQITPDEMQHYLNIHMFAALHGIQAVLPIMPDGGSIINVASTAALRGMAGYVGYGVSKWALRGLTRYAAHDLVGRNIRVNTILPGGVETPMVMRDDDGGLIDMARAAVPMKRFGTCQELAEAALYLASDRSSYMTGAEMVIDGGLNA